MARDHRRLAAIVSADVVGYSLLMGRDDSATLAGLKAHRRELIDPKISGDGGRIVKTTGDGLLLEFPSVVDAVRCAVDVQRGMAERNAGVPPEQRIEFRIGVNVGDIIIDGEDIYGDGVNVAARLQTLAEPGGVCVSRVVRDQVLDKLSFAFEGLGLQEVKNIARPVEVYRVDLASGALQTTGRGRRRWQLRSLTGRQLVRAVIAVLVLALSYFVADKFWLPKQLGDQRHQAPAPSADTASAPKAFSPPAHSIAVLPFANMSGDPNQEYFSDGLSEELLNSLATIRDLQVSARTSSFFFKGERIDIADVGRKLNVGAVLEGSVRKDGNHVRITAELIDAVTGFHLWSQTYDRDLKDILKVQTEIATAVTKALQATLLADADATIEVGGTQNPQALDAYLRGARWTGNARTKEDLDAAIAELSEAIRLDPGFAKPYSLKAYFLLSLTSYLPESVVHKTYEQARATAERAVALAPAFGEAHASLAEILEFGFLDFAGAATEFDRALALSPGDARVHSLAALFFARMGRADEAVVHARRCVALDPFDAGAHADAGNALSLAHRYREAIKEYDQAASLHPQKYRAAPRSGLQFLALGETELARRACSHPPVDWLSHFCLAIAYHKLHQFVEAQTELAAIRADRGNRAAYRYAEIYAQWGHTSDALDWIEIAYELRDHDLAELKVDYLLDPLRKEARFQEIERKLKFPN